MKETTPLNNQSPVAAAPELTGANLRIRTIFLKEDPAKIVDAGLIAGAASDFAKCGNMPIGNTRLQRRSSSKYLFQISSQPAG